MFELPINISNNSVMTYGGRNLQPWTSNCETSPMAIFSLLFLLFLLFLLPSISGATPSPYLSATTLFQNYQNMLATFKIFIYTPPKPFNFTDAPASFFYDSLLRSSFLTHDPTEAHLFFVAFSPDTSTRSLARIVRDLRNNYPYWNRALGADHFFVSPSGIDYSSDRNILELKKNSVQISVFPVTSGYFIPHKDITLPPFFNPTTSLKESPSTASFLGYLKWDGETESKLVNEMKKLDEFLVDKESEPSDYLQSVRKSKFCLFLYHGEISLMVEAMAYGCVPVVIVDSPIQDLPLMDVLRWSDMALLVSVQRGGAGRLKEVLQSGVSEEKYVEMKELGMAASKHLVWKAEEEAAAAQPCDAFHMVMYQMWLRRHVIRYARRDII